jgi:hypothetical protein
MTTHYKYFYFLFHTADLTEDAHPICMVATAVKAFRKNQRRVLERVLIPNHILIAYMNLIS